MQGGTPPVGLLFAGISGVTALQDPPELSVSARLHIGDAMVAIGSTALSNDGVPEVRYLHLQG